jgi:hypothetical protein
MTKFSVIFTAVLVLAIAMPCRAGDGAVLAFEAGQSVIRGPATAIRLSITWPGSGPAGTEYTCGMGLVTASDYRNQEQPIQAVLDCQLVRNFGQIEFGAGPSYLKNVDSYNGSNLNFALVARWRITDRLSVQWRHWSNAGIVRPNAGRDIVSVGLSF